MKSAASWFSNLAHLARANPNLAAFAAGLVLFAIGLAWAWPPLGPIGAGLVLMGISLFGERIKP